MALMKYATAVKTSACSCRPRSSASLSPSASAQRHMLASALAAEATPRSTSSSGRSARGGPSLMTRRAK